MSRMMNLSLLDPQQTAFPNNIVATASVGDIASVAYSRLGTYLAAGRKLGDIWIFANDSLTPLFRLNGHSTKITSLCFSCDNSRLVSGSHDGQVLVWDLSTHKAIHHFRLRSPIIQVLMFPNNNRRVLVLSQCLEPVKVKLHKIPTWINPLSLSPEQSQKLDIESRRWDDQLFDFTSAAFDPTGRYLLLGNREGLLVVYSMRIKSLVHIERNSRTPILQIKFSPNSQDVLLNCRSYLKVIEMKVVDTQVSFGYPVKCNYASDGGHWTKCAFDATGELVIGSFSGQPDHCLHVFDRSGGDAHSTLLGPGDQVLDFAWNPRHSSFVSVEGSGTICLWAPIYRQRWSAWAPSFRELDSNFPCNEEEDAFDLDYASPSHSIHRRDPPPPPPHTEDVTVDITGDMPESFLERPLLLTPSISHELPASIIIVRSSSSPDQASPKDNSTHSVKCQPSASRPHQAYSHALPPRPTTRYNGWSHSRRNQSRERHPYDLPRSRRPNNHRSPSLSLKVLPSSDVSDSFKRGRQYTSRESPRPRQNHSPSSRIRSRHDSITHYSPYSRHSSSHSTTQARSHVGLVPSTRGIQHQTRFGSASLASPQQSNKAVYCSPPAQIERAKKYQKRESRFSRSPRHPYASNRAPTSRRPEASSGTRDAEEGEIPN